MQRRRCVAWALTAGALVWTQAAAQPLDCELKEATGFTEPAAVIEVAAREPGIVAHILVEPGDRVKAGDILADLDKTVTLAELEGARARAEATGRLSAAEAKLSHARRRSEEIAKLEKSRAVRPLELIAAKAELAVAEAELQSAQDELRIAGLDADSVAARLSLLDVRSPFDAVVNEVHREAGELVGSAGDARVVTLFKLDRLHADFFVPSGCIGKVAKGAALTVVLSRANRAMEARLRNLGLDVDAPTGMRRISVEIDNAGYELLGGERLVLALPVGGLER
ncbi:efflux RND transporter periplasmic adaptor subunit [Mesorhizobium sp. 1B3]|uniref:efflux RND transporter periplasmic adaptor subunit n=1 Tax=Mesorhizobium sp. 1B3 TaxID=3243599 RepID=UPI003D955DDD